MIKCCEIDFFLWPIWHAGQVPSYKRTPLTRKRDTFHSNAALLAPFRRTEIDSVFAKFVILLEEEFLRTNLSWKPFRTKNTSVLSKKKKNWNWNPDMCQVLWAPVYTCLQVQLFFCEHQQQKLPVDCVWEKCKRRQYCNFFCFVLFCFWNLMNVGSCIFLCWKLFFYDRHRPIFRFFCFSHLA